MESGKFDLATWETRVMMRYYSSTNVLHEMLTVLVLYDRLYARKVCSRCVDAVVVVVDRFCGFDSEQIPRIKSVIVLCLFLRNGSFHLDKSFLSCIIPR